MHHAFYTTKKKTVHPRRLAFSKHAVSADTHSPLHAYQVIAVIQFRLMTLFWTKYNITIMVPESMEGNHKWIIICNFNILRKLVD
jgi:hypothetical protein